MEVDPGGHSMSTELLDSIRAANREFQEFITVVSSNGGNGNEINKAIGRITRVHLRLKHISKCLASPLKFPLESLDAAEEVQRYRENLKDLKSTIEALQASLLAEKLRLDNARTNMQAARSWAESVRLWS
jgi:hypothetical protein